MEGVTTFLSLTTGVFPIACKTESRIGLLCGMIFSHSCGSLRWQKELEQDAKWHSGGKVAERPNSGRGAREAAQLEISEGRE
jgi:hypothetical protein